MGILDPILDRPRGELVYAETNAVRAPGSTTVSGIPGLDITVKHGKRPVIITASVPYGTAAGATTLILTIHDVTNNVELARTVHDYTGANSINLRPVMARVPGVGVTRRYQMRAGLFSGTTAVTLPLNISSGWIKAEEV